MQIRAMYDGTLWQLLAKEQTAKRGYELYASKAEKPRSKMGEAMTPAIPSREPAAMDGAPLVGKKLK
jgi:hypothetical protein